MRTHKQQNRKRAVIKELQQELYDQLNNLNQSYSKIYPIRLDLYYDKDSEEQRNRDNDFITKDIRAFITRIMKEEHLIGYAWVMEHGQGRGIHYHVILYANGQKQQSYINTFNRASDIWQCIAGDYSVVHECNSTDYKYPALKKLNHDSKESLDSFRHILDYLAKTEQKYLFNQRYEDYDISQVVKKSNRGRPRKK